jgi:hypothetical protein
MKEIKVQLDRIEQKINIIEQKLDKIECDCLKMNNHINFVEKTYSIVRTPLNFLKNKVEFLMGKNNNDLELPLIKNVTSE